MCPRISSISDSIMGFPFDGGGVVEHPLSNDCGTPPSHFEQGHEVVDCNDWWKHWPELIGTEGAPAVPIEPAKAT